MQQWRTCAALASSANKEYLLDRVWLPQRTARLSIWIKQTNAVWSAVAWKWTVRSINYLIAITNK